jgi:tetratricopeptide (TPR) repeat protein
MVLLSAAPATIPKIGDNQRLQIMDKTEKEFMSAIGLMEKKRWDQASAKLEVLIASADPEVADKANNFMADVYAATGRNAESEATLRRSIEYRGEDNGALGNQLACLCVVVGRQGRVKEADEIMLRALDAARNDLPALTVFILRNAAYMWWANGNPDRAREVYNQIPTYRKDDLEFVIEMNKYYLEPAVPKEIGR